MRRRLLLRQGLEQWSSKVKGIVGGEKQRGIIGRATLWGMIVLLAAILIGAGWHIHQRMSLRSDIIILVAGAKSQRVDWGGLLYKKLNEAKARYGPDFAVRRLRRIYTDAAPARAEGEKRGASLVIWGRNLETGLELNCEILLVGSEKSSELTRHRRMYIGDTPLIEPERFTTPLQGDQITPFLQAVEGWIYFAANRCDQSASIWDQALSMAAQSDLAEEEACLHVYRALLLLRPQTNFSPENASQEAPAPARRSSAIAHLQKAVELAPDLFAAHYNLAAIYKRWCDPDGGLKLALQEAQAAVALQPENALAKELLGDIYALERQEKEAIAAYEEAIQLLAVGLQPTAIRAVGRLWTKLGQAHQAAGEEEEAEDAFRAAVTRGQEMLSSGLHSVHVYASLGAAYSALGLYNQSIDMYREALAADADNPQLYCGLAHVYKQQNELESAMATYQKALGLDADDPQTYRELADMYQAAGRVQDAEAAYRTAIKLAPCDAQAYLALGELYFSQGEYALARQHLQQGLAIGPDDALAQCALGTSCYLIQDWKGATHAFQRAISLAPARVDPYLGLGDIYLRQGRYDLAVTMYTQALALSPQLVAALVGLGDAYRGVGKLDLAEAAYKQAVRLAPADAGIRLSLALLYEHGGQLDKAEAAYRELLIAQDSASAHAALASVYQRQGKLDLATDEYSKALRLDPEDVESQTSLALIYIAQDRLDEALIWIQKVLICHPEQALAHFLLGVASEKKGDKEKAIQAYEAAIRYSGENQTLRQSAETQLSRLR